MKKVLFILLVFICQIVYAQDVEVLSTKLLNGTETGGAHHPKFSPSGDYLLFTTDNYAGLKKYDLSDGKISIVTKAPNAGYNVQISKDGKGIIFRESSLDKRNMRHTSLKKINLENNKVEQLVSPTRSLSSHRVVDGTVVYAKDKKAVLKRTGGEKLSKTPELVTIEDRMIVLYSGNTRKVITPNGANASYIWPSISPDGSKLVYIVAGKGAFICDITGANIVSIGRLNAPVWLGNNHVVGMNDIDDGQRISSSSIDVININNKTRQILVNSSLKAMYPAVSADNSSIAFNTDNGVMYIMKIAVK